MRDCRRGLVVHAFDFVKEEYEMFLDTAFLKSEEIFLQLERAAEEDAVKGWVPAYHFNICLLDGTQVGKIDLRIGHNQKLYYGGNIGYRVDEPYRGHHYAAKACKLVLELARKHDLEYVYITCNVTNEASAKTCEYAGGALIATEDLPEDNDMYKAGTRTVKIFRFEL